MQVEYELPQMPAGTMSGSQLGALPPDVEDDEGEEEDPDQGEEEDEGEDEEEVEQVEESEVKEKKKRIIKQRQSLAEKQPGTTIFPMSRIKRIIKADKELDMMTSEATFMISVATEYFIKHFMEEGYTKARLDRRKIVNYKDMAAVVSRSEEFDFLKDVIPAPMPLSEALERRKQKMALNDDPTMHENLASTSSHPSAPHQQNDDTHPASDPPLHPDDLPPLAPSTNPLYPNAIVKKPPNTHAKASSKPRPPPVSTSSAGDASAGGGAPTTPRVLVAGKNAPSTPHSLTTRGSARRSLAHVDVEMMEHPSDEVEGGEGVSLDLGRGGDDGVVVVEEAEEEDRMDEDR